MQRNFLEKFLNKISEFPTWVKEIIYINLSKEVDEKNNLSYIFATYNPVLTDKGKCELNDRGAHFDNNTYNILDYCDKHFSISEITLNTYMSLEEIARYILFGVEEGYIQLPDNSQILNIAGLLAGKYTPCEFFVNDGIISPEQLDDAVLHYEHRAVKNSKKLGQFIVDLGLISQKQLDLILKVKQEAQKRFVLDHNDVPSIKEEYDRRVELYQDEIEELRRENRQLRLKLQTIQPANKEENYQ